MISPLRGMILLNKSTGLTSFQSLAVCKRSFGTKKVGHAGTLDKFAEGLLLVFINEATRLVPFFVGMGKTYEAEVQFGQETDTLDPGGSIIRSAPVPEFSEIQAALPQFKGFLDQVPPSYSAIHIDGKRAYERVLAGEVLVLKPRRVEISELTIIDWSPPILKIRVSCSSGTYIRSLARDIGLATGSAAFLSALKRTRIGPFQLSDSVIPPRESSQSAWCESAFIGGSALASRLGLGEPLEIDPPRAADFRAGKRLAYSWFRNFPDASGIPSDPLFLPVCSGPEFLGIVGSHLGALTYRLVFPPDPKTDPSLDIPAP